MVKGDDDVDHDLLFRDDECGNHQVHTNGILFAYLVSGFVPIYLPSSGAHVAMTITRAIVPFRAESTTCPDILLYLFIRIIPWVGVQRLG